VGHIRKWFALPAGVVPLLCNCFVFTNYQTAEMLPRGAKRVRPSVTASVNAEPGSRPFVYFPAGIRFERGVSDRVNLGFHQGLYFATADEDLFLFNYGGAQFKLRLHPRTLALVFDAGYHLGTGEYSMSLQTGTSVIRTFYFDNGMDLSIAPHWGFVLSGYPAQFLGVHVNTGISGKGVVFRPEIGVANIDFGDTWTFSAGIGFDFDTGK